MELIAHLTARVLLRIVRPGPAGRAVRREQPMRALGRVPLYAFLPLLVLASRAHAQVLPPRSGNPWLERGSTLEIARQLALAPDTRIDHTNLARFQSMLPGGLALLVRAYGLVLHTRAYAPYVPSRGYVAATKAQHGRVQLRDESTSGESRQSGYVAGLPFAAPKTALEVAYNLAHAYRGDDATLRFDVTRVTAQGGVESTEEWAAFWTSLRTKHATLITYRSVRVNDGVQESDFSLRCRSTPRRRERLFE